MANTPAQSDAVLNKRYAVINKTSKAWKYWQDEIATRGEATKELYAKNFAEFLQFLNIDADQLLAQREDDITNKDKGNDREDEKSGIIPQRG